MIGTVHTHHKNKQRYVIKDKIASVKVGTEWFHGFFLYYQEGHPDMLYAKQFSEFLNTFTQVG